MKRTQSDIVVLYLSETPGQWVPSYRLIKQDTPHGWLGTEGLRRAQEIATEGKRVVDGKTYFVEQRRSGKYTEFRVAFAQTAEKRDFKIIDGVAREVIVPAVTQSFV